MHINAEAELCQKCKPVTVYQREIKLAHEQKEKHIFGVNISVNFSIVITIAFAGFYRGMMGKGKCTPGVNGAAVCGCRLQLCQVQLCSLLLIPDLQSLLKSLQNE